MDMRLGFSSESVCTGSVVTAFENFDVEGCVVVAELAS